MNSLRCLHQHTPTLDSRSRTKQTGAPLQNSRVLCKLNSLSKCDLISHTILFVLYACIKICVPIINTNEVKKVKKVRSQTTLGEKVGECKNISNIHRFLSVEHIPK